MYYGKDNIKNMFKLILKEYFNIPITYSEPIIEIPVTSIYDPEIGIVNDLSQYIKLGRIDFTKPTIAILMYSGMHFDQCRPVVDHMFKLLRGKDFNVIAIVGGGGKDLTKNLEAIEKSCFINGKPIVDVLVNLQWFRINGGPYGGPSEPTWNLLKRLNCVLINGLIMYMREISKWLSDSRGLSPIEVITGVALPEIDGAIEPIPSAGLSDEYTKDIKVIHDRLEKKVERIAKWVNLRRKSNSEKKVAIIIYNYPPGEHNVGNAAYLDVFQSLEQLLKKLKEVGFNVDVLDANSLRSLVGILLVNSPQWSLYDKSKVITLSVDEYLKFFNSLPEKVREEVVKVWGLPPGNVNVLDDKFIIPGIILGNVFIGVQPSRGIHEILKRFTIVKTYHHITNT